MSTYTYTVYALIDPREPELYRYVGLTRCQLKHRLQGHYGELGGSLFGGARLTKKLAWLHAIRTDGFPAQIIALEESADAQNATAAELRLIDNHRASGVLTNGDHPAPYYEQTHRTCRFCEGVFPVGEFKNKRCSVCFEWDEKQDYRIAQRLRRAKKMAMTQFKEAA